MPGGNPTIIKTKLDLDSFLKRKNKPLQSWLSQSGISSEESLQSFLHKSEWAVSQELIDSIRLTFVKLDPSPSVPAEITIPSEITIPVVMEESLLPISELEGLIVNPTISEEAAIVAEEAEVVENPHLIQLTNKERKKNR